MNKNAIISQSSSYKKINFEHLSEEKFERQSYLTNLNTSEARLRFKIKAKITPTIQMNFPSDAEFASNLWTCSGCTDNAMGDKVVGSSSMSWYARGMQTTGKTRTWMMIGNW